jgi:hypothetical protein
MKQRKALARVARSRGGADHAPLACDRVEDLPLAKDDVHGQAEPDRCKKKG